jgi:uncharacterized Zn-binding protein involved in type VI secretion
VERQFGQKWKSHLFTPEGFTLRALACIGDKTTYGEVISASATWFEGNKPIAQSGDLARCSQCKGAFPIIGTAHDWSEQQPYVAMGDKVACRCSDHVVYASATQYTTTVASNSAHTSVQTSIFDNPAPPPIHIAKSFAQSFAITDSHTGKPLVNRTYIAMVDGHRKVGLTDSNGIASIEASTASSVIELQVTFLAPARELTEFLEDIV